MVTEERNGPFELFLPKPSLSMTSSAQRMRRSDAGAGDGSPRRRRVMGDGARVGLWGVRVWVCVVVFVCVVVDCAAVRVLWACGGAMSRWWTESGMEAANVPLVIQ